MSFLHITKKINLGLLLIVILAIILRFSWLGVNPNGLSVEEASNGYDTYSILLTGKDRYGAFLPIFARAWDDYIEAIYRYYDLPFVALLGLNEFSVRLPAAMVGTLTVIIIYFLTKELFNNNKIATISCFLLAINPWHIQFSRIGFRAIIFPFLFSLGLWLFLRGLRKPNSLIFGAFFLGLSLYTYSSARVFVPLFIIGLVFIYYQQLLQNKKFFLIAGGIFLLILTIMISLWLTPAGMARQGQVGLTFNVFKLAYNYISYFTPQFLFAEGDQYLRHNPSKMGMLHIFEFITVITGIFYLFKENNNSQQLLFWWLILYPIPAALTAPIHGLRSIIGCLLFSIISGYGIVKLAELIKLSKRQLNFTLAIIFTLSVIGYSYRYFGDYPKESATEWSYGMREAISFAESKNTCITISNSIGLVHIFVLFYTQFPPLEYQKTPIEPAVGVGTIGKYNIVNLGDKNNLNYDCIFMVRPNELNNDFSKLHTMENIYTVKNPDGKPILEFVKFINKKA